MGRGGRGLLYYCPPSCSLPPPSLYSGWLGRQPAGQSPSGPRSCQSKGAVLSSRLLSCRLLGLCGYREASHFSRRVEGFDGGTLLRADPITAPCNQRAHHRHTTHARM